MTNETPSSDSKRPPVFRANAARLKGLGHPLRIELLDHLILHGPATASILAERTGESTGSTSYHLRQLERHGFIEEDATRGSGRERWWRTRPGQIEISPSEIQHDPAAIEATSLIVDQFGARRARQLDKFFRRGLSELGVGWMEAASVSNATVALTQKELAEFSASVTAVLQEAADRFRDRPRPTDARTIVVQFNAFPLVDDPRASEVDGDGE